ncbi:growth arrest and DNA damage-inducible proteins-interacting protein CRIF [Dermacentor variabilis]|uniref:growth arrest and DNA damage-inducible proteins-interacting protein CRIF n=1 Tax=Dermacentor variabilis TaxID=34621 RepID=UPI003F5C44F9
MFVACRNSFLSSPKLSANSLRCCTGSTSEVSIGLTTSAGVRTLSKEEIDRKRDVSRIVPRKYSRGVKLEYTFPEYEYEYRISYMRKDYAKFGRATGINPGLLWPSKEELQDLVHIENKFYPTLQDLWEKDRAKQKAEVEARRQREEEVEKNMAKLTDARIAMLEREATRKAKADEERQQREQMILEVREYIGYNVEPSDPKFKEVMAMKEEERKKVQKEARKKAKQEKMLAKLMAIGVTGSDESKAAPDKDDTAQENKLAEKGDS